MILVASMTIRFSSGGLSASFGGLSASFSFGGLSASFSFGGLSASLSFKTPIPINFSKNSRRTLVRAFVPISAIMHSPATCWIDHSPAATDWRAYIDLSLKWRMRQLPPSLVRMTKAERLSVFTTFDTISNSSARITKICTLHHLRQFCLCS